MGYKAVAAKNVLSNEIHDFTVYPLEGIWKLKNADTKSAADKLIKENLEYTIMIRQPDFITAKMVCDALERVKIKKPNQLYENIIFGTIQDGKCMKSYMSVLMTMNHILLRKWINLQKKTVYNVYQIAIGKFT